MIKNAILFTLLAICTDSVFALTVNNFREQSGSSLEITGTNLSKKRGLDIAIPGDYRDAFGRLRVSEQAALFYSTNVYYNTTTMRGAASGAGASIAHVPAESSVALTTGTVNGETAIRQSFLYIPYVPGKSQLVALTGVLGAPKVNNVRRIGLFDDNNGLFFEVASTGVRVVRRTDTSGAVVDTAVAQSDWNIDKLDGHGTYHKTIDFTKAQIFIIDFQWLGVGRVRFGLDLDGEIIYVHELNHADFIDKVYMASATLPVRYENRNTGVAASPTVLKEICAAVAVEGVYSPPAEEFSISTGSTATTLTTTPQVVIALRMKNEFGSKPNRKTGIYNGIAAISATNSSLYTVVKCSTPSAITATWTTAGALSAVEYSTDLSAITCAATATLDSIWIAGGSNRTSDSTGNMLTGTNRLFTQNSASDNSDILLLYGQSDTGNATARTAVKWTELF